MEGERRRAMVERIEVGEGREKEEEEDEEEEEEEGGIEQEDEEDEEDKEEVGIIESVTPPIWPLSWLSGKSNPKMLLYMSLIGK